MSTELFYLNGQALKYQTEEDIDDDCRKIEHTLVDAKSGKHIKSIDWSPYGYPTSDDIRMYLKLGCPQRKEIPTIGPITHQDLLKLTVKRKELGPTFQQLELALF